MSSAIFVLLVSVCSFAQSSPNTSAIKRFDNGDFAGAVEGLKISDNFIDLNYLGYAYEKLGKEKDARNAFDRSFKNGYKEYGQDIVTRGGFDRESPAPVEKLSDFLNGSSQNILIVALSARRTMELKGSVMNDNDWIMRARLFSEIGRLLASGQMLYSSRELDLPPKIISKPSPGYTNAARSSNTQGTVRLLILLDVDGKVKAALPLRELSHGLTERAIVAASKISFKPAERTGQPVPILQAIEYTFQIR
jgi:hypothetical protein